MMKKLDKRTNKIIISILLVVALLISGAFALLSAYDSRTNRFTQGTLSLSLTETNWQDTNARNMLPLQSVSKNPQVINDNEDNIPAWIFISVKVPSTNTEYETGTAPTSKAADGSNLKADDIGNYYDLFNLEYGGITGVNNDDWELVAYDASKRNQDRGYTVYYYVYKNGALEGYKRNSTSTEGGTVITESGVTSELFSAVQLVDIAQRPDDSKIINAIDVQGSGIQQSNISNVYKAWAIFANQNNGTNNVSNFTYLNNGYGFDNGVVIFN